MAIKGGQIIHVGNGVTVIDRVQTAGPGQLNIPTEKINELGNPKSVATIRDTPDLSFSLESFDVSTEIEKMLTNGDPAVGVGIDLATFVPQDFAGQFKAGRDSATPFGVVSSVAIPYLNLESMSYRFGLSDNATQTATLRGDSIFYNPGPTYVESVAGTDTADQAVVTTHPAFQVAGGDGRYIQAVTVGSKRLTLGADYTESAAAPVAGAAVVTLTITAPVPATENIRIIYTSPDAKSYDDTVHEGVAVKPAAVKGKDIEIYVGGYDPADIAGSQVNKMASVQSVGVDWRVTLDKDEEMGNHYLVAQDFDIPTVNGSLDIKPRDPADLMALIRKITGVTDATKAIGTSSAVPLAFDVVIKHPDTGAPIKRLHVPDARFSVPGYSGRVQQKATVTLPYESDEGSLLIFDA